MANEVIELKPQHAGSSLPVTREDVQALQNQRQLLKDFVQSQLTQDVDYGIVPGTQKNTLYKPGAEKLARLFGLGIRVKLIDKELDRKDNFAIFTYQAEAYLLNRDNVVIAQCEGSCNSQEKKYRERNIYKWVNGKKETVGTEPVPVCDILNTLQKMSQKRAMVGAVILAVAGSDFFSPDIDDEQDADTHGLDPNRKPVMPVQASVPKPVSAQSQDQTSGPIVPSCCGRRMMADKMDKGNWYCLTCQRKTPMGAKE
jgi:hypothetical protein